MESATMFQIIEVPDGGMITAEVVTAADETTTSEELRSALVLDTLVRLHEEKFPERWLLELAEAFLDGEDSHSFSFPTLLDLHTHFVVRTNVDPQDDETVISVLSEFAPNLIEVYRAYKTESK